MAHGQIYTGAQLVVDMGICTLQSAFSSTHTHTHTNMYVNDLVAKNVIRMHNTFPNPGHYSMTLIKYKCLTLTYYLVL